MPFLTPILQEIYDYIVRFKGLNNGNSPAMRDIAEVFGLSTSVIHDHLGRLEAIGLIERGPKGESRMINVLGSTWTPPHVPTFDMSDAPKLRRYLDKVKG